MKIQNGIIAAVATPLTEEEQLDGEGLRRLIDHIINGGGHGLVVLGTTGEAAALPPAERQRTVELAVEYAAGRAQVICGLADVGTQSSIAFCRMAQRAGADAVLTVAPYFYRHDHDTAVQNHFQDIADACPLPTYLYNTPAQTQVRLSMKMVERLAAHPNIVALKDTSGDFLFFQELLAAYRNDPSFLLYQGVGYLLGASVMLGAAGAVAGLVNLVPRFFVNFYQAAKDGDIDSMFRMQKRLLEYKPLAQPGTDMGIPLIKAGLEDLGLCSARCTRPFSPVEPELRNRMRQFVQHCQEGELTQSRQGAEKEKSSRKAPKTQRK